jgi:succinyl-CoA synthetase beta subunit
MATIEECIQKLSNFVEAYREIDEIDINPLMVGRDKDDFKALDVRISLRPLPLAAR